MVATVILNALGQKRCSYCKEFKDYSLFGMDRRSSDNKKGTCKPCCAKQSRQNKLNKFLFRAEQAIPYIAIMRFMKKNPVVFKDFMNRYRYQLEPFIQEVTQEAMNDYNRRSVAKKSGFSTHSKYHPDTVAESIAR